MEDQGDDPDGEDPYTTEETTLPPDETSQPLICMFKRLYTTPRIIEANQRHTLFRTRGTVKGKLCDILVDGGSTDNLIARKTVDALKLPIIQHPQPYSVSWIDEANVKWVSEQCRVPITIDNDYQAVVLCDVVNMNVSHILLGRPWKYNTDYTHRGRSNQIILDVNKKRLVLTPLPPGPPIIESKATVSVVSRAELSKAIIDEGFGWALTAKSLWTEASPKISDRVQLYLDAQPKLSLPDITAELPP